MLVTRGFFLEAKETAHVTTITMTALLGLFLLPRRPSYQRLKQCARLKSAAEGGYEATT